MMKPTSKKMGRPTRNAATKTAHAAFSRPNFAKSQSASALPPPECSRKRPIIAPRPTTTAMKPSASPKPVWIDFSTFWGAIPAARPSVMLEAIRARKACSFATRIRNNNNAMEARVSTTKYGPLAGMSWLF